MFWLQKHRAPKTIKSFCHILSFELRVYGVQIWNDLRPNWENFTLLFIMANLEFFGQSTFFGIFHQSIIFTKTVSNFFYNFFLKSLWLQNHQIRKVIEPFCNILSFVLSYCMCMVFKGKMNWAKFWKFLRYFAKWWTWLFLVGYLLWNLLSIKYFPDNCIKFFSRIF